MRLQTCWQGIFFQIHLQDQTWKVGVFTLESLFSPTVNLKKPPIVLILKKNLGMVDLEPFTMVRAFHSKAFFSYFILRYNLY